MPGSVATLATWISAWSAEALAMSASEANTTPGTRMPGTVPRGTRHVNSSIRSSARSPPLSIAGPALHVQVDLRFDSVRASFDPKPVERSALHRRPLGLAADRHGIDLRRQGRLGGLGHTDPGEADFLRFVEEHQLVQEVHQQSARVVRRRSDL